MPCAARFASPRDDTPRLTTLRYVAYRPGMSIAPATLRPRSIASRDSALDAAARILRKSGYNALTMERVCAESGVAKTTLYRHWPTKAALCMDLYLREAGKELKDPDTGDIERDLRSLVNSVARLQTQTVAGAAFVGLIAEAQINPETRPAFLAEFAERRRAITRQVLRRAIARGQLRRNIDVDLVIDVLGGATTFRLLQGHAPVNRGFVDALIAMVLKGIASK